MRKYFDVLALVAGACVMPLAAADAKVPDGQGVKITQQDSNKISVAINSQPFTDFYIGADAPKPYLHPLRSASGKTMTRGYPMENPPGEAHDHPHHRGLWFTHGEVNGYDFWSNEKLQENGKKGRVVLVKAAKVSSGTKSGTVQAAFNWVGPDGKTVLTEDRKMIFYALPDLRVIDFDIDLKAVEKAVFGDTKEGTFAIRLAPELEEQQPKNIASPKRTGKMVSAQSKSGEKEVWGKRSEWVDYSGTVGGEPLGIAILDYPANPRHPTYWHSRAYGLFAANIFGLHDFENDKSRNGSLTLEPGRDLRFRYRVIIHPGDYQSAHIAALYQDYAANKPPAQQ